MATDGAEILEALEGRAQIAAGDAHDFDEVIAEVEQILRTGSNKAA